VLSQNELGADVGALRAYAQAVEGLGYDFIVTADHVVGSDAAAYPELERVYPISNVLHEPLALFCFLSAAAPKLGMLTSVIILPQRQATLVAKQAASLDLMTGGRFRLGVGIGWNVVEFEALGMNFKDRARRFEEQIEVIHRLTRDELVSFEGRYHTLKGSGINPLPRTRPIPIWIGAQAEAPARRAARIGDGYLPLRPLVEAATPEAAWEQTIEMVRGWVREAGRDPSAFGIEGRLDASRGTPDDWRRAIALWRRLGASHLSIGTGGLGGADAQIARLRDVKALLT